MKYKVIKCHDTCQNCNGYDCIVHGNGKYCTNYACLIKYFNADIQSYETYNKKKQSVYHRKYYILNTINEINKKFNIIMGDYQKYIILNYCNNIIEWEKDNNVNKKINLKYAIKQIYIEFLNHGKCREIKIRNNVRKINEYLILWNKIKENLNFDIPCNI